MAQGSSEQTHTSVSQFSERRPATRIRRISTSRPERKKVIWMCGVRKKKGVLFVDKAPPFDCFDDFCTLAPSRSTLLLVFFFPTSTLCWREGERDFCHTSLSTPFTLAGCLQVLHEGKREGRCRGTNKGAIVFATDIKSGGRGLPFKGEQLAKMWGWDSNTKA